MIEAAFLFGTLRHAPLLEAVLGATAHLDVQPARLPGFRVQGVQGANFPMIEQYDGAVAEGVRVAGLTCRDTARLDFYESVFEYALSPVTLADGQAAHVYLPAPGRWTPDGDWDLANWEQQSADLTVIAAREVLRLMEHMTPASVAAQYSMIRARAASRLRARDSRHGVLTHPGTARIETHATVYAKHFALDAFTVRHSRFDGATSEPLERTVFRPPDAALVLPYDPARDCVLLVEQVRMGPLIRGDRTLWQLEPIAGHIDAGETPQQAARREAMEEAHIALEDLHSVAECYSSPGNSAEFYYVFVARADLPAAAAGQGGLASEHEDIRAHVVPFNDLLAYCDTAQIANAPLLICTYWLARHRGRLRARGQDA